jgi:hypothetical protein
VRVVLERSSTSNREVPVQCAPRSDSESRTAIQVVQMNSELPGAFAYFFLREVGTRRLGSTVF